MSIFPYSRQWRRYLARNGRGPGRRRATAGDAPPPPAAGRVRAPPPNLPYAPPADSCGELRWDLRRLTPEEEAERRACVSAALEEVNRTHPEEKGEPFTTRLVATIDLVSYRRAAEVREAEEEAWALLRATFGPDRFITAKQIADGSAAALRARRSWRRS